MFKLVAAVVYVCLQLVCETAIHFRKMLSSTQQNSSVIIDEGGEYPLVFACTPHVSLLSNYKFLGMWGPGNHLVGLRRLTQRPGNVSVNLPNGMGHCRVQERTPVLFRSRVKVRLKHIHALIWSFITVRKEGPDDTATGRGCPHKLISVSPDLFTSCSIMAWGMLRGRINAIVPINMSVQLKCRLVRPPYAVQKLGVIAIPIKDSSFKFYPSNVKLYPHHGCHARTVVRGTWVSCSSLGYGHF